MYAGTDFTGLIILGILFFLVPIVTLITLVWVARTLHGMRRTLDRIAARLDKDGPPQDFP